MPKGKGTGKPCGESYIPSWKTCRDGQGSHPEFVGSRSKEADELERQILANLERYSPEQQEAWKGYIADSFKEHKASRLKSQEEVYVAKLRGWELLTREGPPDALHDQNGEPDGSSRALVPTVTGTTGVPAWKAMDRGATGATYKFDPGKKGEPGKWRQSTVSIYNDIVSGRAQKAIDYYEQKKREAEENGTPIDYPVLNLGRRVDPKEVERYLREVEESGSLGAVAGNGTNRNESVKVGDPDAFGRALVSAVQNQDLRDKEAQRARAREIISAWLRQDKKSAFTGEPVSIPGVRENQGYPSVVDHNTPLSTAWGGNPKGFRDPEEARRALAEFDVFGNFSITERGLNTAKSDSTDFEGVIIPRWRKSIEDQNNAEARSAKIVDLRVGSRAESVEPVRSTPPVTAPITQRPTQSARARLTGDQQAQLRNAMSRMGRLMDSGLSESEALEKLTLAQRALYNQFMA